MLDPSPELLAARQEVARLHVELLRARDRAESLEEAGLLTEHGRVRVVPPPCRVCGRPHGRADAGHEPRGPHERPG